MNFVDRLYFLVEGPGTAMDLVKASIAERKTARAAIAEYIKRIGATDARYYSDFRVEGVLFDGERPTGWVKAKNGHGLSYPKKGSPELAELNALPRIAITSGEISKALSVPCCLDWVDSDGKPAGWEVIGMPLQECGFAYPGENGPYLLWIPDVAGEAKLRAEERSRYPDLYASTHLKPGLLDYRPVFDGCRQILREEWDLIVAQHKLAKKQREAA